MINVNIVNFITVGIIAVIAILALRIGAKAVGKTSPV
jgi:hypothetical protein